MSHRTDIFIMSGALGFCKPNKSLLSNKSLILIYWDHYFSTQNFNTFLRSSRVVVGLRMDDPDFNSVSFVLFFKLKLVLKSQPNISDMCDGSVNATYHKCF